MFSQEIRGFQEFSVEEGFAKFLSLPRRLGVGRLILEGPDLGLDYFAPRIHSLAGIFPSVLGRGVKLWTHESGAGLTTPQAVYHRLLHLTLPADLGPDSLYVRQDLQRAMKGFAVSQFVPYYVMVFARSAMLQQEIAVMHLLPGFGAQQGMATFKAEALAELVRAR